MQYDPIKRSLGSIFNSTPTLRKIFYSLLDILLLRTWHIKRELRELNRDEQRSILDAGSGFGQYIYRAHKMFPNAKVKGVDVKEEQIEDCNSFFKKIGANNVKCEYTDLTTLSDKDRYNLILSIDVMEHIEEDETVFKNLYRALSNSGTLLISTPSDRGGSDSHHHDHDESSGFIDEHVRDGYSIEDITAKLKRAGFSSVEAKYSYGPAGKIAWLLTMKFPIIVLNCSMIFGIILPIYYAAVGPLSILLNLIDTVSPPKSGTGLIVKAEKTE